MALTRHLYTIPADRPFLRSLAQGLVTRSDEDFARTLILLPTRRACRSLRDTFLALNDGKPVLLPRMQPLGDVDQDELDLHLAGLYGVKDLPDIPPAMSALKRLMLLGKLVQKASPALAHEQLLKLSASLATLIDQVHTENLDFSKLPELAPTRELARHWELTLEFLSIVTEAWPNILTLEGEIDAADRRNRLMQALSAAWQAQPPNFPVIAAGSTGSIPATARLLDVISTLPAGAVILPGLDQDLDTASWDSFGTTHPQATLRALLNRLEVDRRSVRLWPDRTSPAPSSPRVVLARELMRPAETVQTWTDLPQAAARDSLQASLTGLDLIEARTLSDEAQAIAVAMREALETPGGTAALVTPDRELARRVSSALKKWDITVDDSAGCTLAALAAGRFLETILTCVRDAFSPISLLNLLKHPRCKVLPDAALLSTFEIYLCRGPHPAAGFAGLRQRVETLRRPQPALLPLLDLLEAAFAPLLNLRTGPHPAHTYVAALVVVAETLSGGKDFAWGGDDGEAASLLLAGLHDQADAIPAPTLQNFQDILAYLLQTVTVRPRADSHPRLVILGQLEARMIESDVMILGNLNEGSWPAEARHDPWMSRPMREQFGLPSPERSIGLSAHDFSQLLCAPRVLLTRSLKIDGAATVPSRWLQRLGTLLKAAQIEFSPTTTYGDWARTLQHGDTTPVPAPRPEPCPPVAARPTQLSVTAIERWMKNPYHIYVTRILKLRPLEPLDQDVTASERGTFVHEVMEAFLRDVGDGPLPPDARTRLLEIAQATAARHPAETAEWTLWWPRFERLAGWIVEQETKWREQARPWLLEQSGAYTFETARGSFTLTARADRIDRLHTGGAAIIDYKTGTPPTFPKILSGESCQLPLEGLILREKGFGEALEAKILAHWQLNGGTNMGKLSQYSLTDADAPDNLITEAANGLRNLVAAYDQPDTPYVSHPPVGGRIYDEDKAIAHLARVAEWSSGDTDDGGDEDAA